MTLYQVLLQFQYASILLLLSMCTYILKNWKKPMHVWLFFYCIATLINCAGYLAIMKARTQGEAVLAWQLSYLGRVWIPFSIFQFVLNLCDVKRHKWISDIFAGFQAFIYFLVLTSRYHTLYYTSFNFLHDGIFPHIEHGNGIVHHIYDLVILFYTTYGIVVLVNSMRKEKNKRKRRRYIYIILAIITDALFFVLQLIRVIPGYDMTNLGYTIATLFLYGSIFRGDILGTKELARDFVMDRVTEGVVVTDKDDVLVDSNQKAKTLIPELTTDSEAAVKKIRELIEAGKTLDVEEKKYTPKENDLYIGSQVSGKVYMLSDDTEHYRHAEELTREMMVALSKTVDAKDHYTKGHSERVARYSKEIARRMGKSEEEQEKIYEMGLLHDIGKIGVSEDIINKTTRLTDEEFALIKKHTEIGYSILHQISAMPELADGARSHHERFDGNGYPDKLCGKDIPEAARIICVADCYDAMTSTRTYSTPKSQEAVRAEILRCSGSQFDPDVASVMIKMIDDDKEFKMNEKGIILN